MNGWQKGDITMCNGKDCESKHTCYRFTARPNEYRQSYFAKSPIKNNGCDMYLNHQNSSKSRRAGQKFMPWQKIFNII